MSHNVITVAPLCKHLDLSPMSILDQLWSQGNCINLQLVLKDISELHSALTCCTSLGLNTAI